MSNSNNGQGIVKAIFDHYFNTYNGEFRSHLGASMGGEPCLRKLFYSFRWSTMVLHEGRMQRLFQRGHKEEAWFADDLKNIGINVVTEDDQGKQFRLTCPDNHHIGGSCDGFGEVKVIDLRPLNAGDWCVVEMKTHNDKSFKKLVKEGVANSKPLHYSQMNLYMKWSGLTKALYIAVNKNTEELYVEIVEFDQVEADRAEGNMIHVVNADSAPDKLYNDPSRFECKYCDYSDICHKEKFIPEVNCRTCVFSKANPDATWTCRKSDFQLQPETIPIGCKAHIFIPSLLESVATACDSHADEWIEFEFLNGNKIRNGMKNKEQNVYNSMEVRTIIASGYKVFDDNFKALEMNFDAELLTV